MGLILKNYDWPDGFRQKNKISWFVFSIIDYSSTQLLNVRKFVIVYSLDVFLTLPTSLVLNTFIEMCFPVVGKPIFVNGHLKVLFVVPQKTVFSQYRTKTYSENKAVIVSSNIALPLYDYVLPYYYFIVRTFVSVRPC